MKIGVSQTPRVEIAIPNSYFMGILKAIT